MCRQPAPRRTPRGAVLSFHGRSHRLNSQDCFLLLDLISGRILKARMLWMRTGPCVATTLASVRLGTFMGVHIHLVEGSRAVPGARRRPQAPRAYSHVSQLLGGVFASRRVSKCTGKHTNCARGGGRAGGRSAGCLPGTVVMRYARSDRPIGSFSAARWVARAATPILGGNALYGRMSEPYHSFGTSWRT